MPQDADLQVGKGGFRAYTVDGAYRIFLEMARSAGCYERDFKIEIANNKPRRAVITLNLKLVGEGGYI